MISISKKDIYWSYFADFFSIVYSLISLPLILHSFSPDEIGINYILMTIGSLVSLFDFGFGNQFGRNASYVFSGVNSLNKDSVEKGGGNHLINYKLLATLIETVRFVYLRISFFALFILLTFGTYYISLITNGFTSVQNILFIWIIYSISIFFNLYNSYFTSLLTGKGLVKELKASLVFSKFSNVIIVFILVWFNCGLFSIAIANFISPFVSRYFMNKFFFTNDLKASLFNVNVSKSDINDLFKIIWFNAKKVGLISFSASSLTYLSTFIVGLFLTLPEIGSYGLMVQLTSLIGVLSMSYFNTLSPVLSYLYVNNQDDTFKDKLSIAVCVFYILYFIGGFFLIFIMPTLLHFIGSNAFLPSTMILTLFLVFNFFEKNQALFSQLLLIKNKVPFFKAGILTGLFSTLGIFLVLFIGKDISYVVFAQAFPCLIYSSWKWPLMASHEFKFSFSRDIFMRGGAELRKIIIS